MATHIPECTGNFPSEMPIKLISKLCENSILMMYDEVIPSVGPNPAYPLYSPNSGSFGYSPKSDTSSKDKDLKVSKDIKRPWVTATSLIFGYTVFGLSLKIKKETSQFSDFISSCSILYFMKALNLLRASKTFLLCRPLWPCRNYSTLSLSNEHRGHQHFTNGGMWLGSIFDRTGSRLALACGL